MQMISLAQCLISSGHNWSLTVFVIKDRLPSESGRNNIVTVDLTRTQTSIPGTLDLSRPSSTVPDTLDLPRSHSSVPGTLDFYLTSPKCTWYTGFSLTSP